MDNENPIYNLKEKELISMLGTLLYHKNINPLVLSKASGVNIDLCIEFMSHIFANIVFGMEE